MRGVGVDSVVVGVVVYGDGVVVVVVAADDGVVDVVVVVAVVLG